MKFLVYVVLLAGLRMPIRGCVAKELNIDFHQSDYHLKFERVEVVRYSKNFLKDVSLVTYKYNRTTAVVNTTFTLKSDFGNDLGVIVQVYKFLSNEYRIFPIHFGLDGCKALTANTIGVRSVMDCGNFTGCPVLKGKYHICNWRPDQSKFPPLIPNGEYKIQLQILHASAEAAVVDCYVTVFRPIV